MEYRRRIGQSIWHTWSGCSDWPRLDCCIIMSKERIDLSVCEICRSRGHRH